MRGERLRRVRGKTLCERTISHMYILIKISVIADLLTAHAIF